jgi:hypothetical protein
MTKQEFITSYVENAKSRCIGSRQRAAFSAEQSAEKAADEWERINSPEYIERQSRIERLVGLGGNLWSGERVYFNQVAVGSVGRTFDFYVSVDDGSVHGCLTDEERAAAAAILN